MNINKIVWVGGVARSGTSWLGQIFNSSPDIKYRFQPLFSYEFKNWVNEDSTKEEFEYFLQELFKTKTDFLIQKDKINSRKYPIFKKNSKRSCLVFKENRYQTVIEPMMRKIGELFLVGIIRNPCAVLNSWMKNEKEFPKGSKPLKEWRFGNCKNKGNEDYFGYYKWKEVANLYLDLKNKWPKRVYLVRYEDLVDSPLNIVKDIFEFLDLSFRDQSINFIKKSTSIKQEDYYSVYKDSSVKDKWRKDLNKFIISEIEKDLKNTRLEQFFI